MAAAKKKKATSALPTRNSTTKPALAIRAYAVDELVLDPNNLRQHPPESIAAIKASLAQFGQQKPIVVQSETNVVLAGNGTLQAARLLGWPVIYGVSCDLEGPLAAAFAFADNRTMELSRWDFEAVANEALRLLASSGTKLSEAIGFTATQAKQILRAMRQVDTEAKLAGMTYDENADTFFVRVYDCPVHAADLVKRACEEALAECNVPLIPRVIAKVSEDATS